MISLTCSTCKEVLSVDDAFAGGVCRCRGCGTIQTVPGAKAGREAPTSKTLYKKKTVAVGPTGTGLDELADAVASSGLIGGSGLSSNRGVADRTTTTKRRLPNAFLITGLAAVVLVLIGVIVWMSRSRSAGKPPVAATPMKPARVQPKVNTAAAPVTAVPSFCGVKLNTTSVIYLLDRGQATAEVFDALKAATVKSLRTLGSDKSFQIIFWASDFDIPSIPEEAMANATPETVTESAKRLEAVGAYGRTRCKESIERAAAQKPGMIVIATAKGQTLEAQTVAEVTAAVQGTGIKVHTFSLGDSESPILKKIAEQTRGEYRTLGAADLARFAE